MAVAETRAFARSCGPQTLPRFKHLEPTTLLWEGMEYTEARAHVCSVGLSDRDKKLQTTYVLAMRRPGEPWCMTTQLRKGPF